MKILVVTPPGPNADDLVGKLHDRGYDVTRANSGSEALPAALRAPPDVILMDSALSAMDRWHAVKRLNAESQTARVPVLTLSSDAQSPAGLQRVLDKLDQTLGPARAVSPSNATPVASSSRVLSSRPDARISSLPPGSIPPIRRPTPETSRERMSQVKIARRADPLDTGRILVVDDNDLNRDMLSRRLKRRGYDVESVEDGEAALGAVATGRFDLILLDWMMPGLSGLDVLKKLREGHTSVELPVIMATAKTEADDIVEALRAEANDYVTKPLNFDVVHARIRTQLSLVRAHQELRHSESRYRALLENTGDMIVQFNVDGNILYVSPASRTLLGIEPETLKKQSWYDALHAIDRRELLSQLTGSVLPSNFTYIARMTKADGDHIWVETSCRVLRSPKTREVERIQAACRDVTEHIERITGDEPPLPLGGDIMAHPGWRSSTGEPPPQRTVQPTANLTDGGRAANATPAPVPVVVVSTIQGLDASVLSGMTHEQIGARVAEALRGLAEGNNG